MALPEQGASPASWDAHGPPEFSFLNLEEKKDEKLRALVLLLAVQHAIKCHIFSSYVFFESWNNFIPGLFQHRHCSWGSTLLCRYFCPSFSCHRWCIVMSSRNQTEKFLAPWRGWVFGTQLWETGQYQVENGTAPGWQKMYSQKRKWRCFPTLSGT